MSGRKRKERGESKTQFCLSGSADAFAWDFKGRKKGKIGKGVFRPDIVLNVRQRNPREGKEKGKGQRKQRD